MAQVVLGKGFTLPFSNTDFILLCFSSLLIAAAGNIINDYFDIKIDRINKPHKIIVGKYIKRRVAMLLHTAFTGIGLLISFWICYKNGLWKFSVIFLFSTASLWFYATTFKHTTVIGNLIIALLAFMVPFTGGLFEITLLNTTYADVLTETPQALNFIAYWILGYGAFAFVYTFSREITKDIEDMAGDKKYSSKSIPVAWGVSWAKMIIISCYLLAIGALSSIYILYLKDSSVASGTTIFSKLLQPNNLTLVYLSVTVILPTIWLIYITIKAKSKTAFHKASTYNKMVTLFGVLFALVVGYIFQSM